MKNLIISIALVTISSFSFAQKAKIKMNSFLYKYEIYPELTGYENTKTFTLKILDKNNKTLSYSEGNTEAAKLANIHNPLGLAYGFKWLKNNTDLLFEIKQNTSEAQKKEFLSYQDPTTKVTKNSYMITAKQNYTVKIFDVKNDNKLLKEITLDVKARTDWPGSPSATVGYNSKKLLESNYAKKGETSEGFYQKIDARLIKSILKSEIGKEITTILHDSKAKLSNLPTYVKTKDDKFTLLDSAIIYIEKGLEEIKINSKSTKKGNHHLANAQKQFSLANSIYEKYAGDEYIDWFTDKELKEQYIFGITANTYLTKFLTSDFKGANDLYIAVNSKVENEKAIYANDKSVSGAFSSLKRSPAQKALDNINIIRPYMLREEALFEIFKTRFGY